MAMVTYHIVDGCALLLQSLAHGAVFFALGFTCSSHAWVVYRFKFSGFKPCGVFVCCCGAWVELIQHETSEGRCIDRCRSGSLENKSQLGLRIAFPRNGALF